MRALVTHRTVAVLVALAIAAVLGVWAAGQAAAALDPGVRNVTAVSDVTATDSVVLVEWAPATALQRKGLSWTTVRFGHHSFPMIVLDPATHDVSITDVKPGSYEVSVEFDYGPRSNYTHTSAGTTRVTVAPYTVADAAPLAPTGVSATATDQSVTISWKHNPAETVIQHADDYVLTVGATAVTVVSGYGALSGTVSDVTAGFHPVTVTARNSAGDSPAASGAAVEVTLPGPEDSRSSSSAVHSTGTPTTLLVVLITLLLLMCIGILSLR